MAEVDQTLELEGVSEDSTVTRKIAWIVLSAPVVLYLLIFPVKARLDQGETEHHLAGSIWEHMSNSMPNVSAQTAIEVAFWIGASIVVLGSLSLIWLALGGVGSEPSTAARLSSPVVAEHGEVSDTPAGT